MPPDIQEKDVKAAIEAARNQVIEQPDSGEAWGHLGLTLAANLFDQEADRCLAEATRLSPDPRWPFIRGVIALKRDPDRALPLLREGVEKGGEQPELQYQMKMRLGEALLERKELDEAEGVFASVWEQNHNDARAALGLGMIALARGGDANRAQAEKYLLIARNSPGSKKSATIQLASAATAREAREAYAKEVESLPDDAPWPELMRDQVEELQLGHRGRERRITKLENQRQFAEAARLYLQAAKEEPSARNYTGAGINLARLKEYEKAVEMLVEAVKLEPDSSQAHYTLALVQFTRAERLQAADASSPQAAQWFQDCVEHAKKAAELKPSFARAYQFWGLGLLRLKDPAEAVAPLRKGVECQPAEFELQLGLGEALLRTKQYSQAGIHLANAKKIDPNDPRVAPLLDELAKLNTP
jgi:tetratricopeptide (TPR) repeat protein